MGLKEYKNEFKELNNHKKLKRTYNVIVFNLLMFYDLNVKKPW